MIELPPPTRWRRRGRFARVVAAGVSAILMATALIAVKTTEPPAGTGGTDQPWRVDLVSASTASTAPSLQLQQMTTASASGDRRQYVFALAEDKRVWASEQLSAGGAGWSDWYPVIGGGAFCQPPTAIVNSSGYIEVYAVGCDMVVYRAIQTGSGQAGWSGWHLVGSCCIATKVAVVLDGSNRFNVFGLGTDGALYTVRQTSAGANTWSGWGGLGGYLTSAPVAGVDIYGHPYVYALGGDKNVYYMGQETIGGPNFGAWLGWYGIGGGPFIGEIGLLVARRADGRMYTAQKTGRLEHTAWQPLGEHTFISDPVNASSARYGYDPIFGGQLRTPNTIMALGTDRQLYINQACQAGMPCYTYSAWTGWHLAAAGTFLTPPAADWSPDFRRLQFTGMGLDRMVYVNAQVNLLDLGNWTGWTLKPGNGIRADCTLSWPAGKVFYPREYYRGCQNELFTFQENGQAALYGPDGKLKWATPAAGAAASLTIQSNGNMVLYDALGQRNVWTSNTSTAAPKLSFGRDGNLVLFNDQGNRYPVWWSNRNKCENYEWAAGTVFQPGDYFVSCTGEMFTMRASDGNVFQINSLGEVAWATNALAPGGRMQFQNDGNLVVYNQNNQAVWASNSSAPGGTLEFTDDAHLLVLDAAGLPQQSQADRDKARVRQKLNEFQNELNIQCAPGGPLHDRQDKCQAFQSHLNEWRRVAEEWQPSRPCVGIIDVAKMIFGIHRISGSIGELAKMAAQIGKAAAMKLLGLLGTIGFLLVTVAEIARRCQAWHLMEDLLREQKEQEQPGQRIGLMHYPLNPNDFGFVNWSFAAGPNGNVTSMISDAFVVGHPEWRVEFPNDPQTPGNTVVSAVETTRDGVPGTFYTMGNGDTMFMAKGKADMTVLYERDNSTGQSVRTLYDKDGNYVITVDSERGLVNVNDGWGGNNPFSAANGGWGWGTTGFAGWTSWAGAVGGGGGGGGGSCSWIGLCAMLVG